MNNFNPKRKTKSGIQPSNSRTDWSVRTVEIQGYMQDLVTKAINAWNGSTDKEGKPLPKIGNIRITLCSYNFGWKKYQYFDHQKHKVVKRTLRFAPLLLILPLEAQPDFNPNINANEWIGFYETNHNLNSVGKKAKLLLPLETIVNAYGYNDYDLQRGAMSNRNSKSREFFNGYHMKESEYREFFRYASSPRVCKIKNEYKVLVFIDPARIISDMIKEDGTNMDVYLDSIISYQLQSYDYRYEVVASNSHTSKQKKKVNDKDYYTTITENDLAILTKNKNGRR